MARAIFLLLCLVRYGTVWLDGKLIDLYPATINSVPLLAILGIIAAFTIRRTGTSLPGALICAFFVTWYIVAGQATQVAF